MTEVLSGTHLFVDGSHSQAFTSNHHASKTLGNMEKYYLNGQFTDVVLIAGKRRIPAHRLVLSAGSDYFAAMFTNDLKEATQNEIEMQNMNGDVLEALIKYCYTGKIKFVTDTAQELLGTACLLQLSDVVDACCKFFKSQFHPCNCIGILRFADSLGCTRLVEMTQDYIFKHFAEVMKNEEFLRLSPDEMAEILASDDLRVPSEEAVFQSLMMWIKKDLFSRKEHLNRLLKLIRFPLLSPSFIVNEVATNPSIQALPEFRDLILETFKYHLLPQHPSIVKSQRTYPRNYYETILVLGGRSDDCDFICSAERFNLRLREWTKQADISFSAPVKCEITEFEGKLYVCGGQRQGNTRSDFWCFSMKTKNVTRLPPMPTLREGLSIQELNGFLYAAGGYKGCNYLNSVDRFDMRRMTWSSVSSMSNKRSEFSLGVLGGKLYAVGGYSDSYGYNHQSGFSCTVECYDPSTNKWTDCGMMRAGRSAPGVGVLDGLLYVVGGKVYGESATNVVERYDPKKGTWTKVASMNCARWGVSVCVADKKLFAIGGYNGVTYLKTVEMYNPQDDVWVKVAPLNYERYKPVVIGN